jgi:hypothetical protein
MRAGLCVFAFAACSVEPSIVKSGNGAGQDLLPTGANADYTVTIDLGATQASFLAQYYQGSDPVTGTEIQFAGGESVAVNGLSLQEQTLIGVSYGADGALVDPGQSYVFQLTVPSKGSFSTPIPMPQSATMTSPADGVTVSPSSSIDITWTVADPQASDEIDVELEPNGDGQSATATVNASAGATDVTLSATEMKALYTTAVGSVGGKALGTVTLKRSRTGATGKPFAGGQSQIVWTLGVVHVTVGP